MADHDTDSRAALLSSVRRELDGYATRARALIDGGSPEDEAVTSIVEIVKNISHLFVYVEGNSSHLGPEALESLRMEMLESEDFRRALLEYLSEARCSGAVERLRAAWTNKLRELVDAANPALDARRKDLHDSVERILEGVSADRSQFLTRLGVTRGSATPEAAFFRLISRTANASTRSKLALAWDRQSERRLGELAEAVDRVVELRWERALGQGHQSPLTQSLRRSSMSAEQAESFVNQYLAAALDAHRRLEGWVAAGTRLPDDPMNHFAYFLHGLTGDVALPLFQVDACIDLAAAVTRSIFGYLVVLESDLTGTEITLSVRRGDRLIGLVRIGLLETGRGAGRGTEGVHPADDQEALHLPTGRALCRYVIGPNGQRLVSFEAAHSLLHEFGHALTRVLAHDNGADLTGLDYLPVERLEDLSEWFEKWVYHEEFAARTGIDGGDRAGLDTCRNVKKLEFLGTSLQRAATAALDLSLHKRRTSVLESFRLLDDAFGISRYCRLGDLLRHFTRPVFRTHPGIAGVTYLRGYVFGAQQFERFAQLRLSDVSPDMFAETFRPCFDPGQAGGEPDVARLFAFYEQGLALSGSG